MDSPTQPPPESRFAGARPKKRRRHRRRVAVFTLVGVCSVALCACAGADQQGSPAHRMSVWVSGTGFGQDVGTLIADNARVAKVVPNGTGAVHAACGAMVDDAEKANSSLPSPDPKVTDLLTQAYGLEGTAANECYNAGATDKKLLEQSRRNAVKAEALYQQVLQRIRQIDGKTVSTTTTTNNSVGSIFG